jgi:hypothetical protein
MTPDYRHPLTRRARDDIERMLAEKGLNVSSKCFDELVVMRLRQIQPLEASYHG